MGEPEDNERPSREDGDSLNSDDGSGEYAALGAYTYIRDRRADPDDESLKDYTAVRLRNVDVVVTALTSSVQSKHRKPREEFPLAYVT